jgi:hypothetical protein
LVEEKRLTWSAAFRLITFGKRHPEMLEKDEIYEWAQTGPTVQQVRNRLKQWKG